MRGRILKVFGCKGTNQLFERYKYLKGGHVMGIKGKFNKICSFSVLSSIITPIFLYIPTLQAQQVLEEVIVTAQRRVQSIQEVPISLEAFSGEMLTREGLRTMEDLSNFSPSVEIDIRTMDQDIAIRGMGTTGNNLGLEQAAPTFVDGVHYGRTSMIQGAFLDLERIEVLRGPQPIYFGQNATAGAFSLTTRKPGPEWQGDINVEYGDFGRAGVEGGIGGPITDTLGIRIAGQYDKTSGYIKDIVTGGMFPKIKESAARATLQWKPIEPFEMTFKTDWSQQRRGGDGAARCTTIASALAAGISRPLQDETAILIPVPGNAAYEYFNENVYQLLPLPDCSEGGKFERIGVMEGAEQTFSPIPVIYHSRSSTGIIDISSVYFSATGEPAVEKFHAHDDTDTLSYRLGMIYSFDHGGMIESSTAYVNYDRSTIHDNSNSPIAGNSQARGEVFDMMSQDLRYFSTRGGMIEWEAGAYWQKEDLDLGNMGDPRYATITVRGTLRDPVKNFGNWQDTRWLSTYGNFTFNFLNNKASVDIGGRYTDVKKESYIYSEGAHLIFDINPDGAGDPKPGDGIVSSTNLDGTVRNVTNRVVDCATGYFACGNFGAGYWTHVWNSPHIPDAWHTQKPVAHGPWFTGSAQGGTGPLAGLYSGPNLRELREKNKFDHQISLRYRATEDLSFYGKWATAFKSGGANIKTGVLANPDQFAFEGENAETYEVGAKGTFWDGVADYNVSLFTVTIDSMQIDTQVPVLEPGVSALTTLRVTTNAGKQRTRGLEMDARWAVSDRLTAGIAGALMDGVILAYEGAGCTEFEFLQADTGPCVSQAESLASRTTDKLLLQGTIDRSGQKAPRTPDWKFVVDLDYWIPIFDVYKLSLGTKTTFSDAYITNVTSFSKVTGYPKRVVSNLNLGYGDMDGVWKLQLYARNLFNAGMEYFPEYVVEPVWYQGESLSARNWRSFGVQFQYNYN